MYLEVREVKRFTARNLIWLRYMFSTDWPGLYVISNTKHVLFFHSVIAPYCIILFNVAVIIAFVSDL